MILKSGLIAHYLREQDRDLDPLVITPAPDLSTLEKSGAASVDLRLGCWFLTLRQARLSCIDVMREGGAAVTEKFTKKSHVPFTADFHLHPNSFVLGITLEWIRLKKDLAGVVTGKSSWGHRGLIIATATGVHCGFTGCLTLKITNLGQIPILLKPGMPICQLFLHRVEPNSLADGRGLVDASQYNGRRKPILGEIKMDAFSRALSISEASPSPPPSATPL